MALDWEKEFLSLVKYYTNDNISISYSAEVSRFCAIVQYFSICLCDRFIV